MNGSQGKERDIDLADVRDDLSAWRKARRGRERIPERIWQAAARAGRSYGMTRVCRALGLDYGCLKRRLGEGSAAVGSTMGPRMKFQEVTGESSAQEHGCVVELVKPNGTRLRVSVPGVAGVDWSQLKAAFLEA